jgi:hypothetical protein
VTGVAGVFLQQVEQDALQPAQLDVRQVLDQLDRRPAGRQPAGAQLRASGRPASFVTSWARK